MARAQSELTASPEVEEAAAGHKDLLRLLNDLRDAGFGLGVAEYLRAFEAAEYAEQVAPGSLETLRNYLSPVLCTNPDQQETFHLLFARWIRPEPDLPPPPPLKEREAFKRLKKEQRRGWRWHWAALLVLPATAAMIAMLIQDQGDIEPPSVPIEQDIDGVVDPVDTGGNGYSGGTEVVAPAASAAIEATAATQVTVRVVDSEGNPAADVAPTIEYVPPLLGVDSGQITHVEFSTDGARILSVSDDNSIRVWDAFNGMELLNVAVGDEVSIAHFSDDGQQIVAASGSTAILWDAETGAELRRVDHGEPIADMQMNANATRLFTRSESMNGRLWALDSSGASVSTDWSGVTAFAFDVDGEILAIALQGDTIRFRRSESGESVWVLPFDEPVDSLSFSDDASVIAIGSEASVYAYRVGEINSVLVYAHGSELLAVHVVGNNGPLLTLGADNVLHGWDLESVVLGMTIPIEGTVSGMELSVNEEVALVTRDDGSASLILEAGLFIRHFRNDPPILSAGLSPNGTRLATATSAGMRIWSVSDRELMRLPHAEQLSSSSFNWTEFSTSGRYLITRLGERDEADGGVAWLWDAVTGEELLRLNTPDVVASASISPSETLVATGGADGNAQVWDLQGSSSRGEFDHVDAVTSVRFSSDESRLVTASADASATVWNLNDVTDSFRLEDETAIYSAELSLDDSRLVITRSGGGGILDLFSSEASLWDVESREVLARLTHDGGVYIATFSADGSRVLTAGGDGTAAIWDAATGAEMHRLRVDGEAVAAFSPDGERVIAGGTDGLVAVWDTSSGQELYSLPIEDGVQFVAISDGSLSLTVGNDEWISIWEEERLIQRSYVPDAWHAALSPDNSRALVTTNNEGVVVLWISGALPLPALDEFGESRAPGLSVPQTLHIGASAHVIPAVFEDDRTYLLELSAAAPVADFVRRYSAMLQAFIAVLVLTSLFFWTRARWKDRTAVLEMRQARADQATTSVRVEKPAVTLHRGEKLLGTAARARMRQSSGFDELDVDATVTKTAEQWGLTTPVFRERHEMPVYLTLSDRSGPRDQAADLTDELLDRLEGAGVAIERYEFHSDPRMCRPKGGGRSRELRELLSLYSDCRVLVFSDGAGLLHPLTGRLKDVAKQLTGWEDVALLTPIAAEHWGRRELDLAAAGLYIVPGTLEGVGAFIAKANAESRVEYDDPWRPPYPSLLMWRVDRWYSNDAPDIGDIDELCSELRNFLGGHGYRWLCSLAVYPELIWQLTLYLGLRLTKGDGSPLIDETTLIDLTRLPWLRRGAMPNWLRLRLIRDLTDADEDEVRDLLRNLMEQQLEAGEGFALNVARQDKDKDRDWSQMLKRIFRSESKSGSLTDQVFVTFLFGKKKEDLQLQAPEGWRRYVFDRGIGALGLR
nr:WD40 repeat domain-containing protein [Woeseiaceae bacterium]